MGTHFCLTSIIKDAHQIITAITIKITDVPLCATVPHTAHSLGGRLVIKSIFSREMDRYHSITVITIDVNKMLPFMSESPMRPFPTPVAQAGLELEVAYCVGGVITPPCGVP